MSDAVEVVMNQEEQLKRIGRPILSFTEGAIRAAAIRRCVHGTLIYSHVCMYVCMYVCMNVCMNYECMYVVCTSDVCMYARM